jgi:hypothetical protein
MQQCTNPARGLRYETLRGDALRPYLHPGWASPEGRIRVLRREVLEDPVAEVSPAEGNVFAFLRSDRSWHGHTPFIGERRVVQVAWLRDAKELERNASAAGWPGG